MSGPKSFGSWLARDFEHFVALKRATGFQYRSQELLLLAFDRFLQEQVVLPPLKRPALQQYLGSREWTPRALGNVVSVLWAALSNAQLHGAQVDPLPQRPPSAPKHWRLRSPRIVCAEEIERLLSAARRLPANRAPLQPATMATLMGLLCVTGLRIGEALALDIGDLDSASGLLKVRNGKFGKSRTLPIKRSSIDALAAYIEHPARPMGIGNTAPIFVSSRRRRLSKPTVASAFLAVCGEAQLERPWPRPHDLRHSFAVNRVAKWYCEKADFQELLPALSTYLGHTCLEHTRLYLVQNGSLLEHASDRFRRFTAALDGQVLS